MAACDAKPLRLRGSQSGQGIVMFAVCLVVVLGAAALVIDVGYAYTQIAAEIAGARLIDDGLL